MQLLAAPGDITSASLPVLCHQVRTHSPGPQSCFNILSVSRHTQTNTHTHTHMGVHRSPHTHTHTHTYMGVYRSPHTHTHIHDECIHSTDKHTYPHTHTHTHPPTHAYMGLHIAHTNTYICQNWYTGVHTYTGVHRSINTKHTHWFTQQGTNTNAQKHIEAHKDMCTQSHRHTHTLQGWSSLLCNVVNANKSLITSTAWCQASRTHVDDDIVFFRQRICFPELLNPRVKSVNTR